MKYTNLFIKIYLYCFGLFWIAIILYFRFVKSHPSYDLNHVKTTVTGYDLLYAVLFILLQIFLISFAFYLIIRKGSTKTPNKLLANFQKIINIIMTKPLESIRDLIGPNIPGSVLFYCKLAEYIEKDLEFRSKTFVLLFYFIPHIFMTSIFFIELIFYHKIEYFLYSLLLWVIPISWNIFVSLFYNFGERSIQDIQRNVKVVGVGDPGSNGWFSSYQIHPLPQFNYKDGELKEWADSWTRILTIYAISESYFKDFKNKISPYITIITSSLYLSATAYKLIFLLF